MDTEDYRKKIENDILQIIEDRLKARKMDAERARTIARFILDSLHPHMTLDEIYKTVESFDDNFPELMPAVLPVANDYEEKMKIIVTQQVEKLIKENKIDEASVLMKKAFNKEVKVGE